MKKLYFLIMMLSTQLLYARSLKATADKLAEETTRIGHGIAMFGIAVAGIYFLIGRQDAGTKMSQVLMGVMVVLMGQTIFNFVKGLV